MSMEQVSLRVPAANIARADRLKEYIASLPYAAALAGGKVSRGVVLRLAVEKGLETLEAEQYAEQDADHGQVDY